MQALRKPIYTPEGYLELERAANYKSEYCHGEIFAMAGASERHNTIAANTLISIGNQLKGRPCKVYGSDMRVDVRPAGLYTYPDATIVCGKPQLTDDHMDTLRNPAVIIEILSDSTEAYDRGEKFRMYRTLESLTDYILISQNSAQIDHYQLNDGQWRLTDAQGLEATLWIENIQCSLPLAEVYDKVGFPPEKLPKGVLRVVKEESPEWQPSR